MPSFEETELFGASKKTHWVTFFRELGFTRDEIMWLEKELGYSTEEIPESYLKKASVILAQSFGELMPKMTWLLDAYTPFPYSKEQSSKVIVGALERANEYYPDHSIPLRYTTKTNPHPSLFPELSTANYIGQENQGKIDVVSAMGFLQDYEAIQSYYTNIVRASNEFVEFELVFSYDRSLAQKLLSIIEKPPIKITYCKQDRTLSVGKHTTTFRSGLQADLCGTLLTGRNLSKEWAADEIYGSWGLHEHEYKDQNRLLIYQTGKKINDVVSKMTNGEVSQLLSYTTKSAAINPKYRKFVSKC